VVGDVFQIFVVEVFLYIIVNMHRLISVFSLFVSCAVFGNSSSSIKVQIFKKNMKKE